MNGGTDPPVINQYTTESHAAAKDATSTILPEMQFRFKNLHKMDAILTNVGNCEVAGLLDSFCKLHPTCFVHNFLTTLCYNYVVAVQSRDRGMGSVIPMWESNGTYFVSIVNISTLKYFIVTL